MRQLRARPLHVAIKSCLLLMCAPMLAQAQDSTTLDTVQITGSRIKKAEVEGKVPVQTLTREDLERSGLNSIGDVIQNLTGSGSR